MIKDTVFILAEHSNYFLNIVLPELKCEIIPEESDTDFGIITVKAEKEDIRNLQDFLLGKLYL